MDGPGRWTNSAFKMFIRVLIALALGWVLYATLLYCDRSIRTYYWQQVNTICNAPRNTLQQEIQRLVSKKAILDSQITLLEMKKEELYKWSDDLAQQRRKIAWTNSTHDGCSAYGIKRHTATLSNVPAGIDPKVECFGKKLRIGGKLRAPTDCLDMGLSGKITGIWDFDSHHCKARISDLEDAGCYRPGGRQYKGTVQDIQDDANWSKICYTIPGFFKKENGFPIHLGLPDTCSPCIRNSAKILMVSPCYSVEWKVRDSSCA